MDGFAFIFAVLLLASLSAGALWVGFRREVRDQDPEARIAPLKRHLSDIDAQYRAGLIASEDHGPLRAEVARRLLATATQGTSIPMGTSMPGWLWALALATPALAVALYLLVGSPGLPDAPYRARVAAWRDTDPARLQPEEIGAVLSNIAKARPSDPDPLKHLAMVRQASGDAMGAVQALRKATALAPGRTDLWVALGEASMALAKGEVDDAAQAAFVEVLKRDPANPSARYHLARAQIASGAVADGLAGWAALARDLAWDDPRRLALQQEISLVRAKGGLPAATDTGAIAPGAIAQMVQGLARRLEQNPDDPDGWIRLVRAYAVLGDRPRRDSALARAVARYQGQPKLIAALRQAADATPRPNGPETAP
jgi:cytochrome c-type biogenesis protein CcmH